MNPKHHMSCFHFFLKEEHVDRHVPFLGNQIAKTTQIASGPPGEWKPGSKSQEKTAENIETSDLLLFLMSSLRIRMSAI